MPDYFGEWIACTDGTGHYRLGGRTLCGAPLAPSGGPVSVCTRKHGGVRFVVPLCAACRAVNEDRWAGRRSAALMTLSAEVPA